MLKYLLLFAYLFFYSNLGYTQEKISGKYNMNTDEFTSFDSLYKVYDTVLGYSNFYSLNGKGGFGLIDSTGNVLLKPVYVSVNVQDKDYCICNNGGFYVLFNLNERRFLTPAKYWDLQTIHNNFFKYNILHKYGIIDSLGIELTEPIYDDISFFKNKFACVTIDRKSGFINAKGKLICDIKYEYDADMEFKEGMARVCSGGKWGFLNENGEEAIPPRFDYVSSFNEGLARVCRDSKWGFINKNGDIIISINYDAVWFFENERALVIINETPFFIDKKGNIIETCVNYKDVKISNQSLEYFDLSSNSYILLHY